MARNQSQLAKEAVNQVVNQVTRSLQNLDSNRIEFAQDIYWARDVINWRLSHFKSFKFFIEDVLKMYPTTAYRYIRAGRLIKNSGYSDKECQDIVRAIGWVRFVRGLEKQKRKCSVKQFIMKYKTLPSSHGHPADEPRGCFFQFSLPETEADIFTAELEACGMRILGSGKRAGVREAMTQLVQKHFT